MKTPAELFFKTLLKFPTTANTGIATSLILILFAGASKFCLAGEFLRVFIRIFPACNVNYKQDFFYKMCTMEGDWLNLAQMNATMKMYTPVQTSCLKCSLLTANPILHPAGLQLLDSHSS